MDFAEMMEHALTEEPRTHDQMQLKAYMDEWPLQPAVVDAWTNEIHKAIYQKALEKIEAELKLPKGILYVDVGKGTDYSVYGNAVGRLFSGAVAEEDLTPYNASISFTELEATLVSDSYKINGEH